MVEKLERKQLRKATLLLLGHLLFNWEAVMDLQALVSKIHYGNSPTFKRRKIGSEAFVIFFPSWQSTSDFLPGFL